MSILIFIVILVVLILVHEFGHFIVAKWTKMRVDEFGIGFPPKITGWKPKGGETEYSINAIPFGGFVKIFGEDPDNQDTQESARSFVNRPKWAQAVVIVAGVAFNMLLAWLLISATFMAGAPSPVAAAPAGAAVENARLTIVEVLPDTPAAQADVRSGDVIVGMLAGEESPEGLTPELVSDFVATRPGERIAFTFDRAGEILEKEIVPAGGVADGDRAAIGVSLSEIGIVSLGPVQALYEGGKTTVALTGAILTGFWEIITGAFSGGAGIDALTGPVGIVGLVGDAADFGFIYLLSFTAFISINLAIINLIPFPALDGGRLLFIIIEAIKGSPIRPVVANVANSVGFALLILLMIVVTYNDIIRIVAG